MTITNEKEVQGQLETTLPPKPFYQRTEFWLSLAALIIGGLMGSGIIGPATPTARVLGMLIEVLSAMGYTIARTMAKGPDGMTAPGYKSSEFWLSALAAGGSLLQSMDAIPSGSPLEAIIAALLATLAPGTYAVARGKLKSNAVLSIIALTLFVSGCASWQTTTERYLSGAHGVFQAAADGGQKYFAERCKAEALVCRDARRAAEAKGDAKAVEAALACPTVKNCLAALQRFDAICIAGELAVLDGLASVKLAGAAQSKDVQATLDRVKELVSAVQTTLSDLGVTP